jgi:hypothetical protein
MVVGTLVAPMDYDSAWILTVVSSSRPYLALWDVVPMLRRAQIPSLTGSMYRVQTENLKGDSFCALNSSVQRIIYVYVMGYVAIHNKFTGLDLADGSCKRLGT